MDAPAPYIALYDGQCEICQAGVTWIRFLDRRKRVECAPFDAETLARIAPGLTIEDCGRELHVVGPGGRIWRGGAAVRKLARLFPATWILGVLFALPPLSWIADLLYRLIAKNRYQLSKCRGGACKTTLSVGRRARPSLAGFWSCYTAGLLLRIPLIALSGLAALVRGMATWVRTRGRRMSLLHGRLQLFFLGGFPADVGSILFGEQFWMILYDGFLIDPGSPRLRRSVAQWLRALPAGIVRGVVATHGHEEHIGNLAFAAGRCGAPVYAGRDTARIVRFAPPLPFMRALIIGQPPRFTGDLRILGDRLDGLQVFPTPGHCPDHVVLYDPREKVLLSGDAFMATYFSSPNPDVDSRIWLDTLVALSELEIDIMLTGHGHVYTLRGDVPELPGVVIRRDPRECIREKLAFMRWLRSQVVEGVSEGLPLRAIEATLFPWNRRWAWENFFIDELFRVSSGGEFSRTELVRTFIRRPDSIEPEVYEFRRVCATR